MEGHLHGLATLFLPAAIVAAGVLLRANDDDARRRLKRVAIALPVGLLVVILFVPVRLCAEAPPTFQIVLPLLAWTAFAGFVARPGLLAAGLAVAFVGGQLLAAHYYALPDRGYAIRHGGRVVGCRADQTDVVPLGRWYTAITGVSARAGS